jgi:hypothetical protein
MEVFCTLVTLLLLFNTFLLIGIARFLVKLIKYVGTDDQPDRTQWANIIRQRRTLQMQEGNEATYADPVFRPSPRPAVSPRYWDGVSGTTNWDGLPKDEE